MRRPPFTAMSREPSEQKRGRYQLETPGGASSPKNSVATAISIIDIPSTRTDTTRCGLLAMSGSFHGCQFRTMACFFRTMAFGPLVGSAWRAEDVVMHYSSASAASILIKDHE